MRTWHVVLLILTVALLMAGPANADGERFTKQAFDYDWQEILPEPMDEFADSIAYWNAGDQLWYFNGSGQLYCMTRFSSAVDFQLQGVSALTSGAPAGGTVVYLYWDNNGSPGASIGTHFLFPTIIEGNPTYMYWEFDEDDYVDIPGGEDFWVVLNTNNFGEWMPYFDDAPTGTRSWYGFNPSTPAEAISGDWYMTAGGQYSGTFYDVAARFLSNNTFQFHLQPDQSVSYTTEFINNGNEASPAGQATFTVTDTLGIEVFSSSVDVPALDPGASMFVSTPDEWTAPESYQRYIAEVDYSLPNDGNNDNNNYKLLQQVIEYGVTYAGYDDGTPESNVIVNTDRGQGSIFYPPSYPAELTSVAFQLNEEDVQNVTLRVFSLDNAGSITELWVRESAQAGLNVFNFPTPFQISQGGFFCAVCAEGGTVAIPVDGNPPLSGVNNPLVSPEAMNFSSGLWLADDPGSLYIDSGGNYIIRAKMAETQVADLVWPALPFDMGDGTTGEPTTFDLPIENVGEVPGHILELNNIPAVLEIPATADLPIEIAPGETYNLSITWTPDSDGSENLGFFMIHDDLGENDDFPGDEGITKIITLTGFSTDVDYTDPTVPETYFLNQNLPNPFNPSTTIEFGLKQPGKATLTVYNVMGQEVARLVDEKLTAGTHTVQFNGKALPSGVYFYELTSNDFRSMQKMVLMK